MNNPQKFIISADYSKRSRSTDYQNFALRFRPNRHFFILLFSMEAVSRWKHAQFPSLLMWSVLIFSLAVAMSLLFKPPHDVKSATWII